MEKFLNWLSEGDPKNGRAGRISYTQFPKRLASPKVPLQIAQRSLPSPRRLRELVAEYDAKQLQAAHERYESFLHTGYPAFTQWVESLVEKAATWGGRFLLLTFDNATGIVFATTQPHEILSQTSYALPISQSALPKLVVEVAEHFRKANFHVQINRQESTFSRLGAQVTPAYDCLDIWWAEKPYAVHGENPLHCSMLPAQSVAPEKRHVGFAATDLNSIKPRSNRQE